MRLIGATALQIKNNSHPHASVSMLLAYMVLGNLNLHVDDESYKAAQDFLATMGLSQVVTSPAHTAGHSLDLDFLLGLEVRQLGLNPMSWTDGYFL